MLGETQPGVILGSLFGGVAVGAIAMAASYRPTEISMPNTTLNLNSDVKMIDDRSVIFNYFSDIRGQYMDLELPNDMYNFLQTHLPDKKYNIVSELEKRQAVRSHESAGLLETTFGQPAMIAQKEDDMEIFKRKVEKLKVLKEAGLLTDEEFIEERNKLLAMI